MGLGKVADLPDGDGRVMALLEAVIEQHQEVIERNRQWPSVCHSWQSRLQALESFRKLARSLIQ